MDGVADVELEVFGGRGGNTFDVNGPAPKGGKLYLQTGTGNDTVTVEAISSELDIYNNGNPTNGQDKVYLGSAGKGVGETGTLAGISGKVIVYGVGQTVLVIDDFGDTAACTGTINSDGLTLNRTQGTAALATNVSWAGGVTSVQILGGSGGNTFDVNGPVALSTRSARMVASLPDTRSSTRTVC